MELGARRIFRILRPGGRVAISDITLSQPLAPELSAHFQDSWAGCMGGALPETDYLRIVSEAGFSDLMITTRHTLAQGELAAMSCCPGEKYAAPPLPRRPARPPDRAAGHR